MKQSVVPSLAVGKQDRLGSSASVRHTVFEKENTELKPDLLRLNIDLESHPARSGGVG